MLAMKSFDPDHHLKRPDNRHIEDSAGSEMLDFSGVCVIIPCLNEEANIRKVVSDFRHHLPKATICVYDNGSTDRTIDEASADGAIVRNEPRRGKGRVVRRMFRDIDAAIYLMVDGDNTYTAADAPAMVRRLVSDNLDMVVGRRVAATGTCFRYGHRAGNRLLTQFVSSLFGSPLQDMLSGYRVMSQRFVKSFPVSTNGFEIETEMTIHMLQVEAPFVEVETAYFDRDDGSVSKLRTFPDGLRVLRIMAELLALERPMRVFGGLGLALLLASAVAVLPVLREYALTGSVPRFPTLIAASAVMIAGMMSIFSGVILRGVARMRRDAKRLAYLEYPATQTVLTTASDKGRAEEATAEGT